MYLIITSREMQERERENNATLPGCPMSQGRFADLPDNKIVGLVVFLLLLLYRVLL